jgi:hypothetical protein
MCATHRRLVGRDAGGRLIVVGRDRNIVVGRARGRRAAQLLLFPLFLATLLVVLWLLCM